MDSPNDQVLGDFMIDSETAAMEIEQSDVIEEEEEKDPFLKFINYAKSILYQNAGDLEEDSVHCPGWSWIANRIIKTCVAYSSGVTPAILLSELSLAWNEYNRSGAPKKQPDFIAKLKRKHKRAKLPNTITIDSIYEKKFLSLSSVIEAVIIDAFTLPGTNIYMLTLGDIWSSNTIDLYLHRRFYSIADPKNGILRKGREVLLTGCYLRVATGSSVFARLLPTEYFVVLLDEDEDDDAMLLGAQFCSDSFSSISLDAVKEGASYSLYASVGSMLAIDRPFVASDIDSSLETCDEICLEYGSATQLYLVPLILHKEQVCVTQNHYQGSRLSTASNLTQGPIVSQVTLPCDSQGSIDFSNYPFRSYVVDLLDKMTSVSLYGIVTSIRATEGMFSLRIEDTTGAIWAKLHFVTSWSLGRLMIGHSVYISGLSSSLTPLKSLELSWYENGTGSSFFNLSCLPAFLNTSCLHRLLCLSDLSIHTSGVQVCHVWLDKIEHCHVDTGFMHTRCGQLIDKKAPSGDPECKFCHRIGNGEVERTFRLKITLADDTAKVFAWCIARLLLSCCKYLPMSSMNYPSRRQDSRGFMEQDHDMVDWEVTRAIKCE
ncbi:hypothetical protein Sango_0553600 [Sesamum angolense]|uniref:Nucleic acid-binding protein n=1 Tax=Sesamum angolense TaxID=2727404 RepID=A0AAE2C1F1_9LAMI|nr:hypothetical protein Sango_0553600 [Sesamum angolense]